MLSDADLETDEELWEGDDDGDHGGWFCVRTDPFPCPAEACTFVAEFATAAHLVLVWEERDDRTSSGTHSARRRWVGAPGSSDTRRGSVRALRTTRRRRPAGPRRQALNRCPVLDGVVGTGRADLASRCVDDARDRAASGRARARHGDDGCLRHARSTAHRPCRSRGPVARSDAATIRGVTSATIQVSGVRCERCIGRLAGLLRDLRESSSRTRTSWARSRSDGTRRGPRVTRSSPFSGGRIHGAPPQIGTRRASSDRENPEARALSRSRSLLLLEPAPRIVPERE